MITSLLKGYKAPPRLLVEHDYRTQWDGHKVIRGATGGLAFVTGDGLREGDRIVLDDGRYVARDVCGCDYSDLYLVRLEPVT